MVLQDQRMHGNARVARLIERGRAASSQAAVMIARTPTTAPASEIAEQARAAESDPNATLAYAGVPQKQDPPGGMQFIAKQPREPGLAAQPAGFTLIKGAAAFTPPRFDTHMTAEKDGYKRRYFVEVAATTATDVEHPSYYPGPGTHDNAISQQKDGTYYYYWTIADKISDLIRRGEQEHLNDAKRAFDLTYGLIAKEINAMVGQRFGPADSPAAAEQLAQVELARRLPAALGTDPLTWYNVLEAMLGMTTQRDKTHLHDLLPGKAVERGKTFYIPLVTTEQTSIGQVPSDQIVNYPSGGGGGGGTAPAPSSGAAAEPDKGH
jgi:hypothetical protein